MSADGSNIERRKSRRFPVVVPIEVSWQGTDGIAFKEDAVARQVNANGGFLKMAVYPDLGRRVTLTNFLAARAAEARVLAAPQDREGVANGIIVELIVPNETFWGVELQARKTIAEVENLEKALQCEDLDLQFVKEYRDSVDCIRGAAGTLQKLRESRYRDETDQSDLLATLATDRIRRAINLCMQVAADVDAGRVKNELRDVDELHQAVGYLQERLAPGRESRANDRDARRQKLTVAIPMARNSR
jgi:hypothetical protein